MNGTQIVGILNVTPDSFSDGGEHFTVERACQHAEKMLLEGADWIDVGGESTRPGAESVSVKEEQRRVLPVIEFLLQQNPNLKISIDTKHSDTAKKAIQLGVKMVNDVSAGSYDKRMYQIVAESDVWYVMMHCRGDSKTMMNLTNYKNLMKDIHRELMEKVNQAIQMGVNKSKIILDPGIGFAKTPLQNYQILKNVEVMKKWNYPIMIGASRKSFIGAIDQSIPKERLGGSLAVAAMCTYFGVDFLRVHDVKETVQAVKVIQKIFHKEDWRKTE